MIAIVDHGYANIRSVDRMMRRLGHLPLITDRASDLKRADRIILPGVGAFNGPMQRLGELGLIEPLYEHAIVHQRPILGICVGVQIMTNGSEEGDAKGLGWIEGACLKFKADSEHKLRVPHMGWNKVEIGPDADLFKDSEAKFYFVHSYYVSLSGPRLTAASCTHGVEFCASFQKDNIFGVQFHPEKSHRYGMALLKSFAEI